MFGNKQEISAGNESTNIQGNKIAVIQQNGLSYQEVRQVAMDVFKSNFYDIGDKATQVATKRAEEIINKYIEELQKKSPLSIQNTQDPDVRYSLYEVQKSYARDGNIGKSELLVNLLVERTMIEQHSFETIVLNEALITVPKLTLEQVNILSLIFIVTEIYLKDNPPFEFYYNTFFDKYLDIINIPDGRMFYEHLMYSGCITMDTYSEQLKPLIEQFNSHPNFASFPKLVRLENSWNVSPISHSSLSPVGIAIAIGNLKVKLEVDGLVTLNDYLVD
ncbi:TPA: LPO_1073/Vpar_1526 family protein [Bacillus luti]